MNLWLRFLGFGVLVWCARFASTAPVETSNHAYDDLIVAVGNHLEIISSSASKPMQISLGSYNASLLIALTYDPKRRKLFLSDSQKENNSIVSVWLDHIEGDSYITEAIVERTSEIIEGLTFDPIEDTILWADGVKESIQRVHVGHEGTGDQGASEILHFSFGERPKALLIDPCSRILFWTNWNQKQRTIETLHMDGGKRQIIVEDGLRMPHGLALDKSRHKIYWANNLPFSSFRIERSNFDGTDRELVYSGMGHFIFSLTVSERYVYWTDWNQDTVWALAKDVAGGEPQAVHRFKQMPMGIILYEKDPIDCSKKPTESPDANVDGVPTYPSVVSLCAGYCLNDGECIEVDGQLTCSCTDHFVGNRCQDPVNVTSGSACLNTQATALVRFEEQPLLSALIGVSILCLALLFTVIGLSIRVHRLSQRPRLKRRRFIGSSKNRSSGEQNGPVIDIENCCNMNICETPCVEPASRTPAGERCSSVTGKNRSRKSGDKQELLDSDD